MTVSRSQGGAEMGQPGLVATLACATIYGLVLAASEALILGLPDDLTAAELWWSVLVGLLMAALVGLVVRRRRIRGTDASSAWWLLGNTTNNGSWFTWLLAVLAVLGWSVVWLREQLGTADLSFAILMTFLCLQSLLATWTARASRRGRV